MFSKQRRLGIILCMAALFALVFTSFAAAAPASAPAQTPAKVSAKTTTKTISGVLVEKAGAFKLKTAKHLYPLSGDIDKELVSKKVKVTGSMEKDAKGKTVMVVSKLEPLK